MKPPINYSLVYQLATTKAKVLITHPSFQSVALSAARKAGISPSNILYLSGTSPLEPSVDSLIGTFLLQPPSYTEHKLNPGEGKTKIAFLSFSSGTTGKPKAVVLPHYTVIVNILMVAKHHRVANDQCDRFRPGDVSAGGKTSVYGAQRVIYLPLILQYCPCSVCYLDITACLTDSYTMYRYLWTDRKRTLSHVSILEYNSFLTTL